MPIELHCHGDLGMAVANSIAGAKGAIDGGQDSYINTTVNGIGERAGNADLVAILLHYLNRRILPNTISSAIKSIFQKPG